MDFRPAGYRENTRRSAAEHLHGAWLGRVTLLLRRRSLSLALRLHLSRSARTASAMAHHLVILLLLVGVQDGLDLARRVLANRHHLGHAVLLRKRSIFRIRTRRGSP